MRKLRIRESKVEAFMRKKGFKDMYDMKDRLLVEGIEPQIVPDGTFPEKMACLWWSVRKVVSVVVTLLYLPPYYAFTLLFGLNSILRGVLLFFMLDPHRAARCFVHPFSPKKQ